MREDRPLGLTQQSFLIPRSHLAENPDHRPNPLSGLLKKARIFDGILLEAGRIPKNRTGSGRSKRNRETNR